MISKLTNAEVAHLRKGYCFGGGHRLVPRLTIPNPVVTCGGCGRQFIVKKDPQRMMRVVGFWPWCGRAVIHMAEAIMGILAR